jgi:hypothetical protein
MSYEQKLNNLEQQKKLLIEKRLKEILSLVEKTGALKLDNDLIMGALFTAKNAVDENDTAKLEELQKNVPERFRKPKGKTKSNSKTA